MNTVGVLILGGTITMVQGADGLRPADAVPATERLLAQALPDIGFRMSSMRQVASPSLTRPDLLELAHRINALFLDDGIDAVIVVQGTDTIEETSFFLDLTVGGPKPVIVVGAMRGADAISADGPANLIAAARVACDPRSRGRGCLVVLDNTIHAAADVRKRHTSSLSAFVSPNAGPEGQVVEGRVRYFSAGRPFARFTAAPQSLPDIALHSVALWDDGRLLPTLPGLGYRGLVLEAMGAGHVPDVMMQPLAQLARQMPVILCSRTGEGMVHTRTYGYPGSEVDLLSHGVLPAFYLDARKARILLAVLLGSGADAHTIQTAFDSFNGLATD